MKTRQRNPLAPTEIMFGFMVGMVAFFAVWVGVSVAFGNYDAGSACVDVEHGVGTYGGWDRGGGSPNTGEGFTELLPSATASSTVSTVCADEPTRMQSVYSGVEDWAVFGYVCGFLLVVRSALKAALGRGIFTPSAAKRVTMIGWYVLVGGLALTAVESLARTLLARTLIGDISYWDFLDFWSTNWTAVCAGLGTLTLGRILSAAVPMKEELDATV
ncbi:MAG TPA: hypothetical protein VLI04_08960 [Nocardioidaceae bacterium]|nr:hypothetical protein [Nocardioidaceae bacterium]